MGDEVGGESDDLAGETVDDGLEAFKQVLVLELVEHLYVDLEYALEMHLGAG